MVRTYAVHYSRMPGVCLLFSYWQAHTPAIQPHSMRLFAFSSGLKLR